MDRRTKRELMARLTGDADRICGRFRLSYTALEAERANVKSRYGICYSDGTIKIRLRHASTGRPLKYSSLVNTLCHELAHLRHFNHGPRFQRFYLQLLEWSRHQGIYRPAPRVAAGAEPRGRAPLRPPPHPALHPAPHPSQRVYPHEPPPPPTLPERGHAPPRRRPTPEDRKPAGPEQLTLF